VAERPQVTRAAAYGLIVEAGQIVLCRISDRVPGNAGEWTLPGGGIEFGETPIDAVVREIFEETGFQVEVDELLGVDTEWFEHVDRVVHSLRVIYTVSIVGGALTSELDGSTDLATWFTPAEAHRLPLVGLARKGLALAFPA
jgi:ADP-ribose pyrophosphatase YjhB (NUDIX family)